MEFSHELAIALVRSEDEFPVDFDDAWQWIGYSTKQKAKNKLLNNFESGVDYVSLNQTVKRGIGGTTKELIRLTIDCLKAFGMMAGTAKGKEIRRYFLECERQIKAALPTQPNETQSIFAQLAQETPALEPQPVTLDISPRPNEISTLTTQINTLYGDFEVVVSESTPALQIAKQIGDRLLQLKAQIPHGEWEDFREAHIKSPHTGQPMPSRTASLYQRIAKHWDNLQQSNAISIRDAISALTRHRSVSVASAPENRPAFKQKHQAHLTDPLSIARFQLEMLRDGVNLAEQLGGLDEGQRDYLKQQLVALLTGVV